jgi:hypothetical protein
MMLGIHYHTTSADNVVSLDREQELALEKKVLVEDLYGLQKEISELSVKLEKLGPAVQMPGYNSNSPTSSS